MKQFALSITLFLFSITNASAQWSGTNPVWTNGNVGIGTSYPNTKFHVYASGGGMEYQPGTDNYFEFIDRYNTDATVNTRLYTRNGYFAFHTGSYSERLRITNAGNVGIGTTAPSTKLEIVGSSGLTNFTGTDHLGLLIRGSNNAGTDLSGIDFTGYSADYFSNPLARIAVKLTGSGSFMSFGTSNSYLNGITNTAMTIDYSGNVGIGTTAPNTKFHVYASGGGMEYHPGSENYFEFIDRYNPQASVNTKFYTRNGYFAFHTGGYSERLRITDDGNVGIGTENPSAKLHINGGEIKMNGAAGAGETRLLSYDNGNSFWVIGPNSNSYNSLVIADDHNWDRSLQIMYAPGTTGAGTGDLIIGQIGKNSPTYTHGITRFFTNGTERVRINKEGNLLIGKDSQTNTIYKLDIAGKVRADEIVVNTSGADFVFDPEYNLPNLAEVEKYIKEKKHLPDVAPASEMQKDGMNVSEMQTKLLQKMEEMTLYIIDQEKRIKLLEEKLKEFEPVNP